MAQSNSSFRAALAALSNIDYRSDGQPITPRGDFAAFEARMHSVTKDEIAKIKATAVKEHAFDELDFLSTKLSAPQKEALQQRLQADESSTGYDHVLMELGPLEDHNYWQYLETDRENMTAARKAIKSEPGAEVELCLLDYARLSAAMYESSRQVKGWNLDVSVKQEGPISIEMGVFVHAEAKHAVLAFRGTDVKSLSDLYNDLAKVFAGHSCHIELQQADKLIKQYQDKGYTVSVSGHSLGGFIAEIVATNIGLPGVAFCAPSPKWQNGDKTDKGFVALNFKHDVFGNLAGSSGHTQIIYCDCDGYHHGIGTMIDFLFEKHRYLTNRSVLTACSDGKLS